jgi:signal transduction histidine kinase
VQNRGTGTWTIYLARRIDGPDHHFLGLVLGAMRLSYFEDFYKKIAGNGERSIALFRDDGVLLARHPHIDPSIGRSYLTHGVFRRVLDAAGHSAVHLFSRIDNTTRIVAAHRLAHYPIIVTVSVTERAALAAWREEALYFAGIAGLVILLTIGATAAVARQFMSHALIARLNVEKTEMERARAVAEAALLRQERLSVLGQLTATVAHELRNPLSAIRNTMHTINELAAAKGLTLDRPVGRIERSIARCDKIISNLLDYTRARELTPAPVRLDRWLGEVLDEQKIPDGVTLERRLGAGDARVALDGDHFRRVIINLLENAVQALGEGTALMGERKVTVATRLAEHAEILVEDTGPGIPSDILPRIFEPLFSTKSFGTGLGLPTVRQIVEQHGGEIAITSGPDRGASVRIRLPIAAQSSAAA